MNKEKLPTQIQWLLTTPKQIFTLFFLVGTLLILLFGILKSFEIVLIGWYYVIGSVIINLLVLLVQIVFSFVYKKHQLIILKKTTILLLNIPIAFFYYYIFIKIF